MLDAAAPQEMVRQPESSSDPQRPFDRRNLDTQGWDPLPGFESNPTVTVSGFHSNSALHTHVPQERSRQVGDLSTVPEGPDWDSLPESSTSLENLLAPQQGSPKPFDIALLQIAMSQRQ